MSLFSVLEASSMLSRIAQSARLKPSLRLVSPSVGLTKFLVGPAIGVVGRFGPAVKYIRLQFSKPSRTPALTPTPTTTSCDPGNYPYWVPLGCASVALLALLAILRWKMLPSKAIENPANTLQDQDGYPALRPPETEASPAVLSEVGTRRPRRFWSSIVFMMVFIITTIYSVAISVRYVRYVKAAEAYYSLLANPPLATNHDHSLADLHSIINDALLPIVGFTISPIYSVVIFVRYVRYVKAAEVYYTLLPDPPLVTRHDISLIGYSPIINALLPVIIVESLLFIVIPVVWWMIKTCAKTVVWLFRTICRPIRNLIISVCLTKEDIALVVVLSGCLVFLSIYIPLAFFIDRGKLVGRLSVTHGLLKLKVRRWILLTRAVGMVARSVWDHIQDDGTDVPFVDVVRASTWKDLTRSKILLITPTLFCAVHLMYHFLRFVRRRVQSVRCIENPANTLQDQDGYPALRPSETEASPAVLSEVGTRRPRQFWSSIVFMMVFIITTIYSVAISVRYVRYVKAAEAYYSLLANAPLATNHDRSLADLHSIINDALLPIVGFTISPIYSVAIFVRYVRYVKAAEVYYTLLADPPLVTRHEISLTAYSPIINALLPVIIVESLLFIVIPVVWWIIKTCAKTVARPFRTIWQHGHNLINSVLVTKLEIALLMFIISCFLFLMVFIPLAYFIDRAKLIGRLSVTRGLLKLKLRRWILLTRAVGMVARSVWDHIQDDGTDVPFVDVVRASTWKDLTRSKILLITPTLFCALHLMYHFLRFVRRRVQSVRCMVVFTAASLLSSALCIHYGRHVEATAAYIIILDHTLQTNHDVSIADLSLQLINAMLPAVTMEILCVVVVPISWWIMNMCAKTIAWPCRLIYQRGRDLINFACVNWQETVLFVSFIVTTCASIAYHCIGTTKMRLWLYVTLYYLEMGFVFTQVLGMFVHSVWAHIQTDGTDIPFVEVVRLSTWAVQTKHNILLVTPTILYTLYLTFRFLRFVCSCWFSRSSVEQAYTSVVAGESVPVSRHLVPSPKV